MSARLCEIATRMDAIKARVQMPLRLPLTGKNLGAEFNPFSPDFKFPKPELQSQRSERIIIPPTTVQKKSTGFFSSFTPSGTTATTTGQPSRNLTDQQDKVTLSSPLIIQGKNYFQPITIPTTSETREAVWDTFLDTVNQIDNQIEDAKQQQQNTDGLEATRLQEINKMETYLNNLKRDTGISANEKSAIPERENYIANLKAKKTTVDQIRDDILQKSQAAITKLGEQFAMTGVTPEQMTKVQPTSAVNIGKQVLATGTKLKNVKETSQRVKDTLELLKKNRLKPGVEEQIKKLEETLAKLTVKEMALVSQFQKETADFEQAKQQQQQQQQIKKGGYDRRTRRHRKSKRRFSLRQHHV